jgi:CubicO group peptidase (beta-lactamase class C family)
MTEGIGRGELQAFLERGLEEGLYSGASAAVSVRGRRSLAWAGSLASDDTTPAAPDTLFDLASVTKTFTAATVVRLAERGVVALDAPIVGVLPVGGGDRRITLRSLLTHTSGLPAESFLWRDEPDLPAPQRLESVFAAPLESAPDAVHRYSCLGYIAAGVIAERVTGTSLDGLLRDLVLEPLGLDSVRFGPVDPTLVAATEDQPWVNRGVVRGEVHDETSWYLGGCVGNAGLFATASDVLGLAESLLDDRLFGPVARRALTTDALKPRHGAAYGQAVGARIGDPELVGDLPALGHPGFTGTMWMALPDRGIAAALLTNRVHPTRDRVDLAPFRRRFSAWVAGEAGGA